tara:strand:- start:492 stop:842 length:351 start_codon:yes stop_codon:yes gene_type:complete
MTQKSPITTHILDTAHGRPAANVAVSLEHQGSKGWVEVGSGLTNDDGRLTTLLDGDSELMAGIYRINFDVGTYYEKQGQECFYPSAQISFWVKNPDEHYHVPLLISGFGYSTYRGS